MNFQDISDFISLVKDPALFEKKLGELKKEQEKLNAVIETVGKASELDKLKTDFEKLKVKVIKDLAEKELAFKETVSTTEKALQIRQEKLAEAEALAGRATAQADLREQEAIALKNQYLSREKQIRLQEEATAAESARVAAMAKDLESRLAKLRTVMV